MLKVNNPNQTSTSKRETLFIKRRHGETQLPLYCSHNAEAVNDKRKYANNIVNMSYSLFEWNRDEIVKTQFSNILQDYYQVHKRPSWEGYRAVSLIFIHDTRDWLKKIQSCTNWILIGSLFMSLDQSMNRL